MPCKLVACAWRGDALGCSAARSPRHPFAGGAAGVFLDVQASRLAAAAFWPQTCDIRAPCCACPCAPASPNLPPSMVSSRIRRHGLEKLLTYQGAYNHPLQGSQRARPVDVLPRCSRYTCPIAFLPPPPPPAKDWRFWTWPTPSRRSMLRLPAWPVTACSGIPAQCGPCGRSAGL